jgi:DNA/RNA-binding domain of Phe-tRNA-synthetase-like protein
MAFAGGQVLEITIELPNVRLGVVEAEAVRVEPAGREQAAEMDEVCSRLRRELTIDTVGGLPSVRSVRAMFQAWGVDPSRYRPSSEALLRRVVQGKGLYRVSNVVDLNNLGSIETGWSYGSYDLAAITPPVALRPGCEGEAYEGIGKRTWHLARRPVLADAAGPFGSPISDSTRTMVTEATRSVLTVIFAPAEAAEVAVERVVVLHAERLRRWAGAQETRTSLIFR